MQLQHMLINKKNLTKSILLTFVQSQFCQKKIIGQTLEQMVLEQFFEQNYFKNFKARKDRKHRRRFEASTSTFKNRFLT